MRDDEGYGYEWDAKLFGGPADGCLDRAIAINSENPPSTVIKVVDGNSMRRETLGEKIIEHLTRDQIEGSQRVAVYSLREVGEDDMCSYDYIGTITMSEYRERYEAEEPS